MATALPRDIVARLTDELAETVGPRRYAMWFDQSASFDYQPGRRTLRVAVPSKFAANRIERHLRDPLRRIVDQQIGGDVAVSLEIDPAPFAEDAKPASTHAADAHAPAASNAAASTGAGESASPPGTIHPAFRGQQAARRAASVAAPMRHQLEDFIVGPSNELAYASARRLVEDEHAAGQPVFLHGGCGLGKTHLLQGLCRRMQQQHPQTRVLYTTGERFTNQYIAAVRANNLEQFRKTMRGLDLLAVDDIHFLANKQATQQEFLHSFNEIELGGARLALASDSHPKLIEQFSEALVNRCVRGLVVGISEPDGPTRQRLIGALAKRRGLALQEGAVVQLADHCHGSVREIEGLLTKLHALTTLGRGGKGPGGVNGHQPIGRARVDQLLSHDATGGGPRRPVDFTVLRDTVADQLGVSVSQLLSSSRQKQIVLARAVLVHLARQLTAMSFPEIARAMGRSNHSTTITASKRMQKQIEEAAPLMLPGRTEAITPAGLIDQIKRALHRRE